MDMATMLRACPGLSGDERAYILSIIEKAAGRLTLAPPAAGPFSDAGL